MGFHPNASPIEFYNPVTKCQPDTGTRISFRAMQALEHVEDLILVLGRNADSVVCNAKLPISVFATRRHVHGRRLVRTAEFDCIADQVLEDLLEMARMNRHPWKRVKCYARVTLLKRLRQIGEHVAENARGINRLRGLLLPEQSPHRSSARRGAVSIRAVPRDT